MNIFYQPQPFAPQKCSARCCLRKKIPFSFFFYYDVCTFVKSLYFVLFGSPKTTRVRKFLSSERFFPLSQMFSPHIMLIHRFMMFGNFMDDVRRVYNVSVLRWKAIKTNIKRVTGEINNTLILGRDWVSEIFEGETCLWQSFFSHYRCQRHRSTIHVHITFIKHNKILWHWNFFRQMLDCLLMVLEMRERNRWGWRRERKVLSIEPLWGNCWGLFWKNLTRRISEEGSIHYDEDKF